jgi:hypothetical protein
MRSLSFFLLLFFFAGLSQSQELNALVTVNSDQIRGSNKQVFSTLERSLKELVNQTKWTGRQVKPEERINCAITIIVNAQPNTNTFNASIQIQSTRPVFNASYATPILNIKDDDFNFQYKEFEPLLYNANSFDSNLVSTILFYVYVIIGVDADTFQKNGGQASLKQAENVMLQAQQSGLSAWANQVGKQNRFSLIDNLLSNNLSALRGTWYDYHRKGLDVMFNEPGQAKKVIVSSLLDLDKLHNKVVGNNLLRRFFDAKSDEIVGIFSDGSPIFNQEQLAKTLVKISPNNSSKWRKIN